MSVEVSIRRAQVEDAHRLARLRYEFRASQDPPSEPEAEFLARCTTWMRARLAPGGPWRCWLAEESDELIGTIWLHLIEKLPNPVGEPETHGYVSSLYVESSRRGGGLGSRLLDTCLRTCAAEHLDAVILWPTPRSRSLYERHGFAVAADLLERRLAPTLPHTGRGLDSSSDPPVEPAGIDRWDTEAEVVCPCCGEVVTLGVDPAGGAVQAYVEDCQVCCQPWQVHVSYDDDGAAHVWVEAAQDRAQE